MNAGVTPTHPALKGQASRAQPSVPLSVPFVIAAAGLLAMSCARTDTASDGAGPRVDAASPVRADPSTSAPVAHTQATKVPPPGRISALAVTGNQLVDQSGQAVRLVGVNRFGAEYACAQGWGIFDRPADDALARAIATWSVNSVRILLNEDCWLNIKGVLPQFAGETYRQAIVEWVQRLNAQGLAVIISLAWSAPGTKRALSQARMANADNSSKFWESVASTFLDNPMVLFDLYSEPHRVPWSCWRDGCELDGARYVGMQSLVDVVRSTGARQPLLLSGINYGNDLSQWLAHAPRDRLSALVAGFHLYNFTRCSTSDCWDSTIAPVARQVPVIASELGEDTCRGDFIRSYMSWADQRQVSYLAWAWVSWEPCEGPALVAGEDGTPTRYGAAYRDHVRQLVQSTQN